jgi:hypothetical protein
MGGADPCRQTGDTVMALTVIRDMRLTAEHYPLCTAFLCIVSGNGNMSAAIA